MQTLPGSAAPERPAATRTGFGVRFAQLATIAFWFPCLALDLCVLWRGGGQTSSFTFVFWILYREALVYLAGWLLIGGAHAILFSRRAPAPQSHRRKRDTSDADVLSTGRGYRGS